MPEIWNIGDQDQTNVWQRSTSGGRFFVVQNRAHWLEMFMKEMKRVSRFSKKKLQEQGPAVDDGNSTSSNEEVCDDQDDDSITTQDSSDNEVNDDRDDSDIGSLEQAQSVSEMEDSDSST